MRLKNFSLHIGEQIFKAFSDQSRIRILNLIFQNQEMCISDLELILDFTQTKTSRHLTYMKNSGILSSRKQDQWTFYFINEEVLDIVDKLLSYLNRDPILQKDLETFHILLTNRELAINKIRSIDWKA
jgi:ArsR family transcriptional regulator